jgi:hypothetical protein
MAIEPDLVTATHAGLPGAEKVTSRKAYRSVWWFKGWRSSDDPTFDGTTDAVAPIPSLAELDERTGFVHSWAEHGWGVFDRKIVNQDGAQSFALSVNGNYGRVTGSVAGSGNQRELLVHQDTRWRDGEVTAVLNGPSTYVSGNRPQMGVVLRYQQIGGFHVGFVVWYDIFVGDPRVLNISGWRGNGGATLNQAAGGQYTAEVSRDLRVYAVERISFGGFFNGYYCHPYHLHGLVAGNSVTIDVNDNTYDATGEATLNPDRDKGSLQLSETVTQSAEAYKVTSGAVVLANAHQRYFPYVVKARLIGNTISVKAWRGRYEAEPADWQAVVTVATDADFPTLPSGPGRFGLVASHAHTNSYLEYGDIHFRRLD